MNAPSPLPKTLPTPQAWREDPRKNVLLFGMSGLGKTYLASMLRETRAWFHYSIDYRIGTRYMGEHIVDNFKHEAMLNPFLAELLLTDSIYIASNLTFHNLAPLSTYLGKPGDAAKGGLGFEDYLRRQEQHRAGEIAALNDMGRFIDRARTLYGYPHFVCDTGGSLCEVVDPWDPNDKLLTYLAQNSLMVWIKGDAAHSAELIQRFDADPKPMYYEPEFLHRTWRAFLEKTGAAPDQVDPNAFIRWAYTRALDHRQPRYEAIARQWGLAISADAFQGVQNAEAFTEVIAQALETVDKLP
ncbi:MAG: ATPase [Pseudomonadota bacterium]